MIWKRSSSVTPAVLAAFIVVALLAAGAFARSPVSTGSIVLIPGKKGHAQAGCDPGARVVGLGLATQVEHPDTGGPGIAPQGSWRSGRVANTAAANLSQGSGSASAFVYCSTSHHHNPKAFTKRASIPPITRAATGHSVVARCPKGTRVAFGGYRVGGTISQGGGTFVYRSTRVPHGWKVSGANVTPVTSTLEAIAYCSHSTLPTSAHGTVATVQPAQNGSAVAQCPAGQRARFGGFAGQLAGLNGTDSAVIGHVSRRVRGAAGAWIATGYGLGSGAAKIKAIAYCR